MHYSEGIVRWVKKKTGPAAATIEDKDALTAAEKDAEVIVIGYFKEFKVTCCTYFLISPTSLEGDY